MYPSEVPLWRGSRGGSRGGKPGTARAFTGFSDIRIDAPIDFHVEAPDNIGGFVRYYEIPDLIRVASPIYLKFGLRNAPDVYPSGTHLDNTVIALSRERVRRAEMAREIITRYCPEAAMSPLRAKSLGIPAAV